MGLFDTDPTVQRFDPTPASVQAPQQAASDFVTNLFQDPSQNPFGAMASPLQQQATGGISQFLGQQAPEQQVLETVQPALEGLLNAQAPTNPFGDIGGFDQSQALVGAAQPVFQENLQTALTQAGQAAPSVRGSAFGQQVGDITQQALQDFNLFQQQALQQGLGLDLQNRQQALNFDLGGQQLAQQGALGAAGQLGQLAGQAGQAPFQRLLGAGQLGTQISQQQINPTLQTLLGGLGFAQPMGIETVVGQSPLSQFLGGIGDLGASAAAFATGFGGNS